MLPLDSLILDCLLAWLFLAWCLQVVQPIFNLMAEQIGLMGEVGESPALRLGYDDLNESACMPEVGERA